MNFSLRSDDTAYLFIAVTQLNLGGPKAVQDKAQYSIIAKYNLIAGKKAMEMSEFSIAFNYFDNGISFLRKKHWSDDYNLSLELHNFAAKCALAIKDMTSLSIICDAVSKNARNLDDALGISFVKMCSLSHTNLLQSVNYGFTLLAQLDLDIPASSYENDTLNHINQAKTMLSKIDDEALLNYHVCTDCKKVMAMKILAKMITCINQCKPSLGPMVTVKLVKLTIEHGLVRMSRFVCSVAFMITELILLQTSISALGFACFGGMIADLGDLRGGYRFTKLAKALLKNHCSSEIAGEVMWITSDTLSYIEPLQANSAYRIEAQKLALLAGDVNGACFNKTLSMADLMWSGSVLSEMKDAVSSAKQVSY